MSIQYGVYPTPSREGKQKQPSLHARVISKDTVTTEELARKVAFSSSLTEGDVLGVLNSLSYHLADQLAGGKRVHIKGLGYFFVTATSPSVKSRNKMRGDMVKFKTVKFLPEKTLKAELKNVSFIRSKASTHSRPHTAEEIEAKLMAYLSEKHYITRAEFQVLCNLTRTVALRRLRQFVDENKIKKGGNYNSPVYELIDEGL